MRDGEKSRGQGGRRPLVEPITIRSLLRPHWLGFLFLLFLAAMLGNCSQMTFRAGSSSVTYSYGFPAMVQIEESAGSPSSASRQVRILWWNIALVLVVLYAVSMPLGRGVAGWLTRRRYWRGVFVVILITPLVTFFLATLTSRLMWGYWLRAPRIDSRLLDIERVVAWGSFSVPDKSPDDPSTWTITDSSTTRPPSHASAEADSGNGFGARWYPLLKAEGLFDASPAMQVSRDRVIQAVSGVEDLDIYDHGKPNSYYRVTARAKIGYVLEGESRAGERLLFLSFNSFEVANDHHPSYEILYRLDGDTGDLEILSAQRIYYDVAGMEGFEWPGLFIVYSILAAFLLPPLAALFLMARSSWRSMRGNA